METGLTGLDWTAPWFAPWRSHGERIHGAWRNGAPLHEALNAAPAAPVRFVAQEELPEGEPYEAFIFRTATCPTRGNAHDFFNGLCWQAFPRSKGALNRLQAGELAAAGVGGTRGPVRDAITVFDENGALLDAPPAIWDALLARDWRRLFVDLRPAWTQARVTVFGHALLEKLLAPRKDLTAHVWRSPIPGTSFDEQDQRLALDLTAARLAPKPFTPLPVMGIPGWCAGSENFSFYDDSLVFRPAGRHNQAQPKPVRTPGLNSRG